jgi:DNA polymerase V
VALSVFLATNRFHTGEPQYFNCASVTLQDPADDDISITHAALTALREVYREGYGYKKAGLTITNIVHRDHRQLSIFSDVDGLQKRSALMETVDRLNSGCRGIVRLAAVGGGYEDKIRRERLSSTELSRRD